MPYYVIINNMSEKIEDTIVFSLEQFSIGSHTGKKPTIVKTVDNFYNNNKDRYNIPCQIFLGSPTSRARSFNEKDIEAANKKIKECDLSIYVHGPYIINLAKVVENEWNVKLLIEELQVGYRVGCKGVVVHVGKSLKMDINEAKDIMEKQINMCLKHATPECPLLLETPAKQGTELLSDIDDFVEFIQRFNGNPNFGICVDTCHVFAAGYNPLEYLKKLIDEKGIKVNLVHLNDSKCEKGSCKDRHAFVGEGCIGMQGMYEIVMYCDSKKIHMVTE